MAKHGANLLIGWEGKWMVLQVHFPDIACDEALTLIRADKRGKVRYLREDEEIMAEASRLGLKLDTQVKQKEHHQPGEPDEQDPQHARPVRSASARRAASRHAARPELAILEALR